MLAAGNQKLMNGLLWQLMRYSTLKMVREMNAAKFGAECTRVDDQTLIKWANDRVGKAGKPNRMKSFRGTLLLCACIHARYSSCIPISPAMMNIASQHHFLYVLCVQIVLCRRLCFSWT